MTILYVAYPLQPVTLASSGGAEQILLTLERAMHARGHQTILAGCEGSTPAGEHLLTGPAGGPPDQFEERLAQQVRAVLDYAAAHSLDLIHDHSHWLWPAARELNIPVLATLHLPRAFYPAEAFANLPANVNFNCVSHSQGSDFAHLSPAVVENGIDLTRYTPGGSKSDYLLWIGRICEEKAPHLAIAAARAAQCRLILAGSVYPFSYHQQYFDREVAPHLEGKIEFVPTPSFEQKLALLRGARAVLITSQCNETSSLVTMEALACGTPVVALRRGALPSLIRHGQTGFVVDSVEEMTRVISSSGAPFKPGFGLSGDFLAAIDPKTCRDEAEQRFSCTRMCDEYEQLYKTIHHKGHEVSRRDKPLNETFAMTQ